jgi:hypothetical protein
LKEVHVDDRIRAEDPRAARRFRLSP